MLPTPRSRSKSRGSVLVELPCRCHSLPGWGRGPGPGGSGVSGGGAGRPLPSEARTWASAARQGHAPHWPPPRPDRPLAPEFQKERELLLRPLRVWSSPRWAQRDSGLPLATAPGPLMPPRELLARPGGGRGAGKNPRGRRAGLGWGPAGGWKEVRGVAAASNKAPLGSPVTPR